MDVLKTVAGAIGGMVALAAATAAAAQNGQAPARSRGQSPAIIPGLDTFSLPGQPPRPTPLVEPEPRITPLPRPTPGATPVSVAPPPAVVPTVRPSPRASATLKPAPRPTVAAPVATPTPATMPTATPSPARMPLAAETPGAAPAGKGVAPWLVPGGAGFALAVLLACLWLLARRRRAKPAVAPSRAAAPPAIPAGPVPAPALLSDPVEPSRARVAIALEVKRAGTNLLSAAVEYRIVLRNMGAVEARGVALDLRLLGVEPGLESRLEALFAAPIGQPVVARFDLAAEATTAFEGTAMLPRGAMPPLAITGAGDGRALFVPVMTINLAYGWEGGAGQSAASFVVGLDRGAGEKLGPFRLEGPPRMYDRVSLLPFTVSREI